MIFTSNLAALKKLLKRIRKFASTKRQKGKIFENLALSFFRNEPYYKEEFPRARRYADWAESQGLSGHEKGIDIASSIAGKFGSFCAIRCIFCSENSEIKKNKIENFLALSKKKEFIQGFIVTPGVLEPAAMAALAELAIPVTIIGTTALGNSLLDWSQYKLETGTTVLKGKKVFRPYQEKALTNITQGLKKFDRGILVMATGSGKTLISLRLAENILGLGRKVLYLVPSLTKLSQVLTEWTQESNIPIQSFPVGPDVVVDTINSEQDDDFIIKLQDLQYPAISAAKILATTFNQRHNVAHLSVIFATYSSLDMLRRAQVAGLPELDLIICDDAHRTAGSKTIEDRDEPSFVQVHDNTYINAKKRLYMTATPKIFTVTEKPSITDSTDTVVLYSMEEPETFGPIFHNFSYSEAINEKVLVDYKILIVTIDERYINQNVKLIEDPDNSLMVTDAAKIVGSFRALARHGLREDITGAKIELAQRAVVFCQIIEPFTGKKVKGKTYNKVSSKLVAKMFSEVVENYLRNSDEPSWLRELKTEGQHVDGAMNASEKSKKLNWLRKEPPENTCHFLTNVRCLSEVMDIPALDAVLFLAPRKSTSEIVQSVSIVMRKSPGKDFGYIVVPVVIPEEIELEKAIDHNRTYPVVWQVLQALRSHDDKFSILINKLKHNFDTAGKIDLITVLDESRKSSRTILNKSNPLLIDKEIPNDNSKIGPDFVEPIEEVYNKAVLTRLVKRVGNPDNLIKWTDDVINIADTYIEKIKVILAEPKHQKEIAFFKNFSSQVREDLNVTVTDLEVVEMMAQHMITAPVFEAIYQNIPFVRQNVLSFSMHKLLEAFQNHHFEKETNKLKGFYDSVKQEVETLQERLSWIDKNTWKQNLMIELYEDFFSQAFPKMHERLDIVYTPVEIVDFILKSVNELLENEFGKNLGSNDLHIIDPFTGTGTFISRLLQSGLINEKDLPYKYQNEIHANEIGLLAYYIASINIASVYQDKTGGDYEQFTGICLTDTFQQYEKDNLISKYLLKNSMRRKNQKELPFSVIIGNPLYSIRQKSQSESNKNIDYPILDERIKASYTNNPTAAQLLKGSDDNYIRAFRWASDRLKGNRDGIIGFVTNSNFLEKSAMEGLRKRFAKEFQKIYIVNLRGDIKKNIDSGKSFEGENVFGDKSITGIAMIFLVKKANENNLAKIYYHDIGISLNRTRKLKIINSFGSISGIEKSAKFHEIYPNVQGDWITQISEGFTSHILIASKKSQTNVNIFDNYSSGISTYRDPWCYNFSHNSLVKNIKKTIEFYNSERIRYHEKFDNIKSQKNISQINKFVKNDASQISWSRKLHRYLLENRVLTFEEDSIVKSLYRPFTKSWLYFKRELVEELSLIRLLFPKQGVDNLVICVTGVGSKSNFSVMLANEIPCYDLLEKTQCFPMYLYNRTDTNSEGEGLLQENDPNQIFQKSETITQVGLKHFQDAFPTLNIQREDLFYYIYGILHSSDYRASYKDNLTKELPRIPRVSNPNDFLAFSNAGKELGKLHIDYDNVSKYPLEIETSDTLSDNDYSVTKMKYGKIKNENDLSTIIYNSKITLKGIPLRAYDYILYGKSAIDWIVKSQGLTTDTKSGIVHDSNIWAIETMENPKYPLELLQRVITVSLETLRIIENLPKLELL